MIWLLRAELLMAAAVLARHAGKWDYGNTVLIGTIPIYLRLVRNRNWAVWGTAFAILCLLYGRSWLALPALAGAACLVDARNLRDSLKLLAMPLFGIALSPAARVLMHISPTLDPQLAHLDSMLWGNTGRVIYEFTKAHRALFVFTGICYLALPLFVASVVAVAKTFRSLAPFALATVLGVSCYLLCPATGPAYVWEGITEAPRNAMPSLHVTWALLMVLTMRTRVTRVAAGAFAAITVFATIALGEHYLLDLIAAIPFTFLVWQLHGKLVVLWRRFVPEPAATTAVGAAPAAEAAPATEAA